MHHPTAARRWTHRTLTIGAIGLVVAGAATGILAFQTSSSATSPPDALPAAPPAPSFDQPPRPDPAAGVLTQADGILPAGVTVFDDAYPGVTNLGDDLLHALRAAAMDAAEQGIRFDVGSGWRSPEYQDQLLRDAVSEYGSEAEAARWVATADTSAHVSGDAVDIGTSDATAWLAEHGARYGLCQIYGNESWHYELRPDAIDLGCPALYADPTQDPRMQQ